MSQVISFRASGHFLNWLESQRMEEESLSQCCQRILRVMSTGGALDTSTDLSTPNIPSVVSTSLSTQLSTLVSDKLQSALSDIDSRFTLMEKRLGKLRA
ncbi:MAG: hypothetical protein JGK30_17300 [Microcoleus sp. PH2017_40_RAT_O_B]|uniref:hypothetical protein n=1 Tax=unclassified Microcoleus TaxID=2642155 RepID=UPI001D74CE9B|nr:MULTISPECIES: hypothetical protein [unclassified Microcoleus]MCC3573737.1 hypothetical protein [Microcoleus sp. PH2017_34_RAT_O_A]MCC3611183.1 hypothetical protein [Microcoleus sp. PH2017_40_RAT_O_B]